MTRRGGRILPRAGGNRHGIPAGGTAKAGQGMVEKETELKSELARLKEEHRDLDEVIQRLSEEPDIDDFQLRRMKKRKLHIKDQISLLESRLIPDMNA